MKELALKISKYIAAVLTVLGGLWASGWAAGITLNALMDSKMAKAEIRIGQRIDEREAKIMGIHKAEMDGLHGKIDILIGQNQTIINQNYRTRKIIEENLPGGNP